MSNIVYIFINQSMPDMVKIGITDNVERRVKELSGSTGVPLPFECYYAVKVSEDAKKLEKKIHEGFDKQRVRREREFFYTSPENAKSILEILEIYHVLKILKKYIKSLRKTANFWFLLLF